MLLRRSTLPNTRTEYRARLSKLPSFHADSCLRSPQHSKESVEINVRNIRTCASRAESTQSIDEEGDIENLSRDYCNEFVCTSSPAVEQTVRSFARDILRLGYTYQLFQPDSKFSDGFRNFQGREKYERKFWYQSQIKKPSVSLRRMQMLDKGTAQVDWQIRGSLGVFPVDLLVSSVIEMNLLSGRISFHRESWNFSRCLLPATLAVQLVRMTWASREGSADGAQVVKRKVDETMSTFDEDSSEGTFQDPTDPTRFFQNNQNDMNNDYFTFGLLVALLYLAFRVYGELEQLP